MIHPMPELIRFNDFSYAYPEADRLVLSEVSLTIRAGECHLLGGSTGSGKTSLALAVKGLLPVGMISGSITRAPASRNPESGIGIVLQNPETQILMQSVGAEVAFGLENLCAAPDSMSERITTALLQVGLKKPLDFPTVKLSMGEKYRLLLACQLVMGTGLLILDEPAAQLDPDGLHKLLDIVQHLKTSGMAILLCENTPEPLQKAVDYSWQLDNTGHLHSGRFAGDGTRTTLTPAPRAVTGRNVDAVCVSDMTLTGPGGAPAWSNVSFSLPQGGRTTLYGPNGSGKTTLLRCLLGFTQLSSGQVHILGERPEPANLRGRVGCLFQNPQSQLFETTVLEEVAFPLKRFEKNKRTIAAKVTETLELCRIKNLAEFSPHMLSYGQKHLVALASVIAASPRILFLDDPFAGLDPSWSEHILGLLTHLNEHQGTTLLITSHAPGSLGPWADLSFFIEGGAIVSH